MQKVAAIKRFRGPTNISEVKRSVDLLGLFRKFVPEYSLISKPFTTLLTKAGQDNFVRGFEQQQFVEILIKSLINKPILALYYVNDQHDVHCDASSIGLAGIVPHSTDGEN